jgi:hypothetical protein
VAKKTADAINPMTSAMGHITYGIEEKMES